MQQFIQTHGVTVCPAKSAAGTDWHKPTAYGSSREETAWLTGKATTESNEECLAKAKILTMFEDLSGKGRGPTNERFKYQNDARKWFFDQRCQEDFETWCDVAGLDPDYIREKAREVQKNGMPQWRAAPGEGKAYEKRKAYRERTRR